MISCIHSLAACRVTVFTAIIGASGGALFAALYSQFALGLEPCVLCLYQRIPFLVAIVLGLCGLWARNDTSAVKILLALCAVAFLVNSGLATYHTGVELKWWASAVEGCAVPDFNADPSLLEKMLTSPAASCSDIAWKDPYFGFTMANYNIVYNFVLFLGCLIALGATRKSVRITPPQSS